MSSRLLTAVLGESGLLVAGVSRSIDPEEVADSMETSTTVAPSEVVQQSRIEDGTNWIVSGIILVVGILFAFQVRRLLRRLARKADAVTSTAQIVSQLVFGFIVLVALAVALNNVGIDLTPLLAGAGIIGLTIGFALKDIAENYVAGVIMGFSNPFIPGDQVIIDEGRLEGEVKELQLRYTIITSTDGVEILMPNAMVLKNPVENLTTNGRRRSFFTLGVSFDTDLDAARKLMVDTVSEVEGVSDSPAPEAFVEEVAGSWVTLRVRFWHGPRNHDRWEVRGRAITATFAAFNDAGIDMPLRTRALEVSDITADLRGFDDRSGDGSERQ